MKLLGINPRGPLGYQIIEFYQLTELTMKISHGIGFLKLFQGFRGPKRRAPMMG